MRCFLVLSLALAACVDEPPRDQTQEVMQSKVEMRDIPVSGLQKLDVLIVVDSSPAMRDQLPALAKNLPTFGYMTGGADLHVGVVTADLGTRGADGGFTGPALDDCRGEGGDGLLRRTDLAFDRYLIDHPRPKRSSLGNYRSTFIEAVGDLVSAGASGCHVAQPLEAMRLALDPHRNPGFLRDDSSLAIIFLAAQDDRSFRHAGVTGDLVDVQTYVDFVRGLRPDPFRLFVSTITAPCDATTGTGEEPARLHELRKALDTYGRDAHATMCSNYWYSAVPHTLFDLYGVPCIEGELAGPPYDCSVSDVTKEGEHIIPSCDAFPYARPCWRIAADPQNCSDGSHLVMQIDRDEYPALDTHIISQCVTQ